MAYYHGKVYLNRFEQFEVKGDAKKASAVKQAPKKTHGDFGAGIAAQFGLIKKPVVEKFPLKKKKQTPEEYHSDDRMCQGRSVPGARPHSKQKLDGDCKQNKGSKKSVPKEIDFLSTRSPEYDSDDKKKRKKGKGKEEQHAEKNQKKRHNSSSNTEVSESTDNEEDAIERLKKRVNDSGNGYICSIRNKSEKSIEQVSRDKAKKKRRIFSDEENSDDEEERRIDNRTKPSKRPSEEDNVKKHKTFTIPKISKNKTSRDVDPSPSHMHRSKGIDKSDRERNNHKGKEKKIRRETEESDTTESSSQYSKKDLRRSVSETGLQHKKNLIQRSNSETLQTKNKPVEVKIESTEEEGDTPQKDDIRYKSRLKPSTHLSSIDKEKLSLVKGSLSNKTNPVNQTRASIINNHEKSIKNQGTIEIKSEPDDCSDTQTIDPLMISRLNVDKKHSKDTEAWDLFEKCNSSDVPNSKGMTKTLARIINLGNDLCFIGKTKEISDKKGVNLSGWVELINDRIRKKSTKTDNTVLNYFITLHSRFKVMETMEMADLEVLPEEDPDTSMETEPIRIFTNLSKDHYKQYLDETCLNSIPELIITKLYPKCMAVTT